MFFNEFESNIEKFKANGQEFSVHFGAIWQKLVLALQPITELGVTITVNQISSSVLNRPRFPDKYRSFSNPSLVMIRGDPCPLKSVTCFCSFYKFVQIFIFFIDFKKNYTI